MEEKQHPEATASILILNEEGKVFLMLSPKWKNMYGLPGGHIELGETSEEAARREIMEETGLKVKDIKFLKLQEVIFPKEFYKKKHFISLEYIAKVASSDIKLDNREGIEYVWVTPDEALKLNLNPYTRDTIIEYKKRYGE
jgi:8-oxo-dGTP pyrophosphatase MutT (NUDIX family)